MAAISIVPKVFPLQGITPLAFKMTQLTTADWINLPVRGVMGAFGFSCAAANNTAGVAVTFNYGAALVNSAALTAASTSIPVDGAGAGAGALARIVPFFAKTPTGEIIEVLAESDNTAAASTWTVRRGCLGTTAGALADNDYLSIMNQLVVANSAVGFVNGVAFPFAEDAGSKLFA
jgi:hypothetical protein